ncbi:allantoate amidohydrolase [Streptomyces sp. NPDC087218]|uniref:allantoate amidohydrolase n=1 Tax=Streptomyces sp. NPDC087218 TaxID=3365769 RepID=UPI0038148DAC
MSNARTALDRCTELARITADAPRIERVYLSAEHAAANTLVAEWMERAGLRTWQDAVGNLCGRREGRTDGLPALMIGSHLDTVPDAGAYDGPLGVIMAIAVAERLRGHDLPFALEVIAFNDEEGTRFGTALLGSQAVAGRWQEHWWDQSGRDGLTLRRAFADFGLDSGRVSEAARTPAELVGYLEAHIEQGPYIEAENRSLGFVTAIAGARRFQLSIVGQAGHAGGTPYPRRRDALASACEAITMIERVARESGEDGGIATVGRIQVQPGAVNVIPGQADFTLDLRAATDARRDAMWDGIRAEIERICASRGTRLEVLETHSASACECASWLRDAIATGIRTTGDDDPRGLWSKAGHDAMAMGAICDVAMLFIRCREGVSHNPAEDVREVDVARGINAYEQAVLEVARTYDSSGGPDAPAPRTAARSGAVPALRAGA